MHERLEGVRAAAPFQARFNYVRLSDGTGIRYFEQGTPGGESILMLHGYTDSSFSFSRVLPLLPADCHVIVPDQRGHGDSDRPDGGYSMPRFAADGLELLNTLGIGRAIVVGHSMGSFVARLMAAADPARVSRLVLVAGGPALTNAPVTELGVAVSRLTDPVDPAFAREFQESTVFRPVPREFLELVIRESLKLPARVWKSVMESMLAYEACEKEISCPTLVLAGDQDAVFSVQEQSALAHLIPGARLQIMSGIGHSLQWEDPRAFVRALLDFIPRS